MTRSKRYVYRHEMNKGIRKSAEVADIEPYHSCYLPGCSKLIRLCTRSLRRLVPACFFGCRSDNADDVVRVFRRKSGKNSLSI